MQEKFQGTHKAKSWDVRSTTCEVFVAGANNKLYLGAQSIFLGAPGYWAPVWQQPCKHISHKGYSGFDSTLSIELHKLVQHLQATLFLLCMYSKNISCVLQESVNVKASFFIIVQRHYLRFTNMYTAMYLLLKILYVYYSRTSRKGTPLGPAKVSV